MSPASESEMTKITHLVLLVIKREDSIISFDPETVTLHYWEPGWPSHHHRTISVYNKNVKRRADALTCKNSKCQ